MLRWQINLSNNLDNLLSDIYSSDGQSQGVKELAMLINNLSNLLLKSISQLESRVLKLEQSSRGGAVASSPLAPTTTPAPRPKAASPFKPATPVKRTPPPPPQQRAAPVTAPAKGDGPSSASQAASMLGATLKPAPKKSPTASPAANGSGPSFLTGVVSPNARQAAPTSTSGGVTIDAAAPTPTSGGIAGPRGGFKGELAEKLARRRAKVQQQLEDDFDAPEEVIVEEEGPSSELKTDLEDELRNAFSKLKG